MTTDRAAPVVTADMPLTTAISEVTHADFRTVSRPARPFPGSYRAPASALAYRPEDAVAQGSATCVLSPRPESVSIGREFTRVTILDWAMADVVDAAELVISELVTNALQHGISSARPPVSDHVVRLRLLAHAPFVMCMVTDPGSDIPVLREPDPAAESGRGLAVVEACCVRWGWHLLDNGGKVVWALLRLRHLARFKAVHQPTPRATARNLMARAPQARLAAVAIGPAAP